MLVRVPSLEASMSYYLIQQIEKNDNITVRTCTEVVDTLGEDDHLTGLVLFDKQSGAKETVECDRLCCFIGAEPRTDWLDVVAKDDHGFILSGPDLKDVSGWTLDRPRTILDHCQTIDNALGVGVATPDHLLYVVNVGGYGMSPTKPGVRHRHMLGGLSDATFRLIEVLEAGRDAGWPFLP